MHERKLNLPSKPYLAPPLIAMVLVICSWACGCRENKPPADSEKAKPTLRSRLYPVIGGSSPHRNADIVFVHGVEGDHDASWQLAGKRDTFWPRWLGEDFPQVGIWSFGYPVATTEFKGSTMGLNDRARNFLNVLLANGMDEHEDRPLIFICHSFGGLVVKAMLETAEDSKDRAVQRIRSRTRGVVLIATPNHGAQLADFIQYLARVLVTVTVDDLKIGNPELLRLNRWYRSYATHNNVKTLVFCEKKRTHGLNVVPETAADPGIPDVDPIPLDEDHISICKPLSKDETLYLLTKKFIEAILSTGPPNVPTPPVDHPEFPTKEQVLAKPKHLPTEVTLEYQNLTNDKLSLVLFDCSRFLAGHRPVTRALPIDPGTDPRHFTRFPGDSTGWFCFFVRNSTGTYSDCLGCRNLFESPATGIEIIGSAPNYELQFK